MERPFENLPQNDSDLRSVVRSWENEELIQQMEDAGFDLKNMVFGRQVLETKFIDAVKADRISFDEDVKVHKVRKTRKKEI